jgi:3-oxoacyl-[acyl-carrier-protein] synthase-1
MKLVFGNALPPVTCIKPYVGHTVGASGVIELIIVTESVKRSFLPATPGFQTRDEELSITPVLENLSMNEAVLMLNYFGFGGNCTSLVVSNKD